MGDFWEEFAIVFYEYRKIVYINNRLWIMGFNFAIPR